MMVLAPAVLAQGLCAVARKAPCRDVDRFSAVKFHGWVPLCPGMQDGSLVPKLSRGAWPGAHCLLFCLSPPSLQATGSQTLLCAVGALRYFS